MIPRVRPSYSLAELRAAAGAHHEALPAFERELAERFAVQHALCFPYGRSAIYSCLRALNLAGDVVQPAYNCVVVAHATILAGCRPVFVDALPDSPNQDPLAMLEQVGPQTAAVIPTSIFGMTFDAPALCDAIRRRNPRALIVMDACQCFDARWHGDALAAQGDAAVVAFGIGKPMTTLFGGALLTNRDDLAAAVRRFRDATFRQRSVPGVLLRWGYFLASWAALTAPLVGATDFLENGHTPLHRYLIRLRAREAIRLPADACVLPSPMEAAIGRAQLHRVDGFLARRRDIAAQYARELADVEGLQLLDWADGSAYAIYAARVRRPERRAHAIAALHAAGVQADTTLSYVVPGLECYRATGYDATAFPNAVAWSRGVLNLPNHPTMTAAQVARVVRSVRTVFAQA